jgi:hypothetical protein
MAGLMAGAALGVNASWNVVPNHNPATTKATASGARIPYCQRQRSGCQPRGLRRSGGASSPSKR